MITATLSNSSVSSSSEEAFSLFEKSAMGEKKAGKIIYSDFEALYLLEKRHLEVFSGKNKLSFDSLLSKLRKKDKKIEVKYTVYFDLRSKGYILKEALKFGADFRVYDKGSRPGTSHAPWLIFATNSSDKITWHEFSGKNRIAHSTKKKLLIALVDSESSVSYYEIDWKRL
ncbi:MAG: tRNA-intron lyase [Nanoarchaeota archaeon]|nr:tRNA-intron lyase [Nanoarchaeota archaeon]